jgi:hypothetical protein
MAALWRDDGSAATVWAFAPSARLAGGRTVPQHTDPLPPESRHMSDHTHSNLPLTTLAIVIALWYLFGAALVLVQAL